MNSPGVVLSNPCLSSSTNAPYTDTVISGRAFATKIVAQNGRDCVICGACYYNVDEQEVDGYLVFGAIDKVICNLASGIPCT